MSKSNRLWWHLNSLHVLSYNLFLWINKSERFNGIHVVLYVDLWSWDYCLQIYIKLLKCKAQGTPTSTEDRHKSNGETTHHKVVGIKGNKAFLNAVKMSEQEAHELINYYLLVSSGYMISRRRVPTPKVRVGCKAYILAIFSENCMKLKWKKLYRPWTRVPSDPLRSASVVIVPSLRKVNKQESIPVGCVPSASVAVCCGGCLPGGCLPRAGVC